QQDYTGWFDF
uniref:Caerulein 1.2 n=3 Tax=Pelodryadinae TaxID=192733 RepID=CAE12_LITRO|nr:RecName: Full=Caerulein-1.2/1.2Y4 [Ranoidea citropa]P62541.1 RecName: Full=Caerulein-1.2 [Ranoidea splendida]P86507.1 RecName: Full=Caerulein 1.2 [Litoria rothii]